VSIPCDDLSSFLISCTMDIKALSVLDIDEVLIFISEDLPPS
jgi:predicted methyltransferase